MVKQENIWSVNIDALGSSSVNDRFTTEILEQNKNSWIMEATVTSFVSINRSTYLKGYSCAVILPL